MGHGLLRMKAVQRMFKATPRRTSGDSFLHCGPLIAGKAVREHVPRARRGRRLQTARRRDPINVLNAANGDARSRARCRYRGHVGACGG